MKEIIKMTSFLAVVSFAAGIGLSLTNYVTDPIIKKEKVESYKTSLKEVMPNADDYKTGDNRVDFLRQTKFIAVSKDNKITGEIFVMEEKGYGGKVKVLVGINNDKEVTGIKILEHKETPGLGSLAESPEKMPGKDFSFLEQFKGRKLSDKWEVKKDIAAITGATITTRAVTKAVLKALNSKD
jgi:electron transport complex protein RnfG